MAYGRGGQGKVEPDRDRIRADRQKDQEERERKKRLAMAASIRAKAKADQQAKIKADAIKAEQVAQKEKERQEKAMAASIRAKAKADREADRLAKIADRNRRQSIYQDARLGMEDPTVSPVVQKLLDESINVGTAGTIVKAKRGGSIGYTQRWKNARRKNSKT